MTLSYIELYKKGRLQEIRDELIKSLEECNLCPRNCRVNRLNGDTGFCKTAKYARVSSAFLHYGEEPEIVGRGGSGTIFFSYCNLGCVYCQNYSISHDGQGKEFSANQLAERMFILQEEGAENINFVTPTHVIAQIIESLCLAVERGLKIPLVYNCGGYESIDVLKKVRGVFDIYMPDVKYSDNTVAVRLSNAPDYWDVVQDILLEMHNQVGDLIVQDGVAGKGLLLRHLVLPNDLAGSFKVLDFIKEKISENSYVNIMDQYRPCYKAFEIKELARNPLAEEVQRVRAYAEKIGLSRGFSIYPHL